MKKKRESGPVLASANGHGPVRHMDLVLSSGAVLPLKPAPPMLDAYVVLATGREPQPPKMTIEVAGVEDEIDDVTDEAYQKEMGLWRARLNITKLRIFLKYSADMELTPKQEADVDEMLRDFEAMESDDMKWVESARDRVAFYVLLFMMTTQEDFGRLATAMRQLRTGPSQEGVEAARAAFPSAVQGP